ncbi:MAG: nickel-dependent hydrogenase large subunit, partial [bacterium]
DMPPWTPCWPTDRRLNAADSAPLVTNYLKALDMRRKAHEMAALFGGKMPHPPTFVPGGITTSAQAARITKYLAYLDELIPFITDVYLKDVQKLGEVYPEYSKYGAGVGNLLAFGVFSQDNAGKTFMKRGRIVKGNKEVQAVDLAAITEDVTYSWYDDKTNKLAPANGETLALNPKEKAYSWLKAPRYQDLPYEAGPLARMVVNGDYTGGISVYDRHLARAQEALKVANELRVWAKQVQAGGPERVRRVTLPSTGTVSGLTEAPRGALGHWVQYTGGKISRYQIITPTCWNASPRDSNGVRGPIEQALIGTPVKNTDEPIEVVRVIHSFDPCLACAVHVMRPGKDAKIVSIPHFHSEEEEHRHG